MALSHNVNINVTVINILFEGKLMNKYEDKGLKKKSREEEQIGHGFKITYEDKLNTGPF